MLKPYKNSSYSVVNKSQSDAILKEVRKTIKKYSFQFTHPDQQAKIISGKEEGTFGWVTANYVSGNYGVVSTNSFFFINLIFSSHEPGLKLRVRNRKIIFLFLNQNICCGYSKEPPQ